MSAWRAFPIVFLAVACAREPVADDTGDTEGAEDTDGTGPIEDPWFCAAADYSPTELPDGRWSILTDHYDLRLAARSEEEAADFGRLAEAAWLAWADDFEAEPDLDGGRLRVEWYATEPAWAAAIAADGDPVPSGAGGYYSPNSRAAYLWTQPTIYYNATLLLHEMTHQFHFLSRTGNGSRAGWFVEGLAEFASRHDWDGDCVRLGRIPLLTQEDHEAQAAASMAGGFDLAGVLAGTAGDRPQFQATWRYLSQDPETRDGFEAFRRAYDADGSLDVAAAFADDVGDAEALGDAIAAWAPTAQQPMSPVYLDWVHVGPDEVRVEPGGVLSFSRVKAPVTTFSATAAEGAPGTYVGVLMGWDGPSDWDVFLVGTDGSASNFALVSGEVVWTALGAAPAGDGERAFTITWEGGTATVEVDGAAFPVEIGSSPGAGLASYAADATFTGIGWQ